MSHPRITTLDAIPAQPWRNGGGVTRELLAQPAGEHWRVRVSVADIERDGPFSAFPGIRRHFAVLQGAGVELDIDGRTHRVTAGGTAVSFDGAAATTCRLIDGPTRDLNLMVRGEGGALEKVAAGAVFSPRSRACGLFTTAAGTCRAGALTLTLAAFSLAWFEHAPASLAFDATGWWLAA